MSIAIADVEKLALDLSERDRAKLASRLLRSLPPENANASDDDEFAEVVRRDREMDLNPERGISIEQLDRLIANRHPR